MPTLSADALLNYAKQIFASSAVPPAEASVVSRSLVDANLRGHDSHGVMRIPQYLDTLRDGKMFANAQFEVFDESPAMIAADAHWGIGQVQAHRLLDVLLAKAQQLGVAAGTLRRCGHIGRLGEYAERAATQGMVLIGTVNSHGQGTRVAPPGGIEGRISTNPLCIGAPTPADPLVLDIGTSVCAEGKVRVAYQKGERIPVGWIQDVAGQPTTDPRVLYEPPLGSMLPLGGPQAYKGFGLGLLLDVLSGGLSGGLCSKRNAPKSVGNAVLFILLNTARFGGATSFRRESGELAQFVRECPRAAGVESIMLPGDPEKQVLERRSRDGIPIPDGLWNKLAEIAKSLGLEIPRA